MNEILKKVFVCVLTISFLLSVAFVCLPEHIKSQWPRLIGNICIGYSVIGFLVIFIGILSETWKIFRPPTPWQKYDDDDEGAKGL